MMPARRSDNRRCNWYGLRDCEKMFYADLKSGNDISTCAASIATGAVSSSYGPASMSRMFFRSMLTLSLQLSSMHSCCKGNKRDNFTTVDAEGLSYWSLHWKRCSLSTLLTTTVGLKE
jgi:hypothetical protein